MHNALSVYAEDLFCLIAGHSRKICIKRTGILYTDCPCWKWGSNCPPCLRVITLPTSVSVCLSAIISRKPHAIGFSLHSRLRSQSPAIFRDDVKQDRHTDGQTPRCRFTQPA